MERMVRATRIATAAMLMAALACLPVLLDHCSASCEAHQTDAAATPPCHHAQGAAAHVGHVPAACHHDHAASIGALQAAPSAPQHSIDTIGATPIQLPAANGHAWNSVSMHPRPGSTGSIHASSLPLRV
jgi:hypothetical protein